MTNISNRDVASGGVVDMIDDFIALFVFEGHREVTDLVDLVHCWLGGDVEGNLSSRREDEAGRRQVGFL